MNSTDPIEEYRAAMFSTRCFLDLKVGIWYASSSTTIGMVAALQGRASAAARNASVTIMQSCCKFRDPRPVGSKVNLDEDTNQSG